MWLKFIRYFFFLNNNWGISLATKIIKGEIKGEKKYGINSIGYDDLSNLEEKGIDLSHATFYMPALYPMLEHFFEKIPLDSRKHFLDIGCGKGRAMCVAAHFGFKKLSGIDFSKELTIDAKSNLEITKKQIPNIEFKVICNDAFYYEIPDDVDCIFMFNPFDLTILSGVLENIEKSLESNPRILHIIYFNSTGEKLIFQYGFKEIFQFSEMHFLQGKIFKYSPKN